MAVAFRCLEWPPSLIVLLQWRLPRWTMSSTVSTSGIMKPLASPQSWPTPASHTYSPLTCEYVLHWNCFAKKLKTQSSSVMVNCDSAFSNLYTTAARSVTSGWPLFEMTLSGWPKLLVLGQATNYEMIPVGVTGISFTFTNSLSMCALAMSERDH